MLAQIPHVLLAAHSGTIMGVEKPTHMQVLPRGSQAPEAKVHPGIYARRDGKVVLTSISGPGFGYRLEEISRELPAPAAAIFALEPANCGIAAAIVLASFDSLYWDTFAETAHYAFYIWRMTRIIPTWSGRCWPRRASMPNWWWCRKGPISRLRWSLSSSTLSSRITFCRLLMACRPSN